ncbi:MAG: hypothetical protein ACRDWB_11260, partial [Acidimicrobiales bacterium]
MLQLPVAPSFFLWPPPFPFPLEDPESDPWTRGPLPGPRLEAGRDFHGFPVRVEPFDLAGRAEAYRSEPG